MTEQQKPLPTIFCEEPKKETIFPSAWHGGIVKVALPKVAEQPQEIHLVVDVAGEKHKFRFMEEKVVSK
ncbi:hypothetical protein FGF66_07785 [Chlorobaculum thiosulfatiphilum]|uniref:Uncharacterized protein n=2 Tax=Chlorobaculum thiosulfatiphilum TaxID=115852 RepID=A0A5C4S567_CHLTI|nr:hypothetical protein FGF66_07785 [Chlorobaculum thiosulfatiphilum]